MAWRFFLIGSALIALSIVAAGRLLPPPETGHANELIVEPRLLSPVEPERAPPFADAVRLKQNQNVDVVSDSQVAPVSYQEDIGERDQWEPPRLRKRATSNVTEDPAVKLIATMPDRPIPTTLNAFDDASEVRQTWFQEMLEFEDEPPPPNETTNMVVASVQQIPVGAPSVFDVPQLPPNQAIDQPNQFSIESSALPSVESTPTTLRSSRLRNGLPRTQLPPAGTTQPRQLPPEAIEDQPASPARPPQVNETLDNQFSPTLTQAGRPTSLAQPPYVDENLDSQFSINLSQPEARAAAPAPGSFEELPVPNNRVPDAGRLNTISADLLLQSARNAVRGHDYVAATERFLSYLKKKPEDTQVRFEFAGVLVQTGRLDVAARQFEHLRAQVPGEPQYLRAYADLLLQSNDARAEPLLQLLTQYPDYQSDAAIELARIYASTQRKKEAVAIYERILQYQFPKEAEAQLKLARLLNEINLPNRALQVLGNLEASTPMNTEVIRELIVASARMGDETSALIQVEKLANIRPEDIGLRDQLAKQLHDEGFYQVAMMLDQQVLSFDPTYRDSLIRTANSQLRMYEPEHAISTLRSFSGHQADPEFLVAQGEYHSMLGEHADAIATLQRVLTENPDHVKARMGLGGAYMRSGQFQRAATEYSKASAICSNDPCGIGLNQTYLSAQLARARALAQSGLYCEAVEIVQSVNSSCELAHRDQVIDASLDVLSLSKNYNVGIELARNALNQASGRTRREAHLRAKLGLMMVRGGKYSGALKEFEVLESQNANVTPEQIYGTYTAHQQLGNEAEARKSLFDHFGLLSNDTYLRVRVAELATEDCNCCLAQEVLSHLSRLCKTNVMVGNRLGEACLQCSRCETSGNCAGYFHQVLQASPSNVQAMKGLARTNTRQGNFLQAREMYHRALQHTPEDIGLIRESARMMNQWRGPAAANQLYQRATSLSSGNDLFDIAQASPNRVGELEQDYQSLAALNSLVATEVAAKRLGGWRPLSAIQSFEGLAALEPTNQDALFEIAQAHSSLNRTHCAIAAYQRLLQINPCHTESKIALARNWLELRPRLDLFGDFRYERGREDLVNVTRDQFGASLTFPLRDEDEFIKIGYRQETYRTENPTNLIADIPFARFQFKPAWPILAWAQVDFNTFNSGLGDRINFEAGFRHRYYENASYRMRALQENVFQNSESINQNIFRTGFEIGHFWQPTQRFTIDAFYRYWDYSDDNFAHMAGIYTGYTLRQGRRQVRWLTNLHMMFFDEGTIIPNPPSLVGAIHPYFSPENFGFLTGGLEWRNLLSCNTFKGANRRWIQGFIGARIDSEGAGYLIGRGEYYHDISQRVTFRAYTELVGSSVYDLANVGANLTVRF